MKKFLVTGILLAAVLAPVWALAQEDEAKPMVWTRFYEVQPGKGSDFMTMIGKYTAPALDKLVEDGTLIGWGVAVPFTIQNDDWTHMLWLAYPNWGSLDKLMVSMEEVSKSMSPADMEAFEANLVPGSRRDLIMRHMVMMPMPEGADASKSMKYVRLAYYRAKPMKDEDIVGLYKQYAGPVLGPMVADGTVGPCGFSVQEIPADGEWTHLSWAFTGDLATLDTINKAFEEADAARSEEDTKKLMASVEETIDFDAYHAELLMVIHLGGAKE